MAHFAQIDENGVVLQVIVVGNEHLLDEQGEEKEEIGISFCKRSYGFATNWVQTSYNHKFRVRYASIGGIYDKQRDVFNFAKPADHFIYDNETNDWVPDPAKHDPELLKLGIPYSALA